MRTFVLHWGEMGSRWGINRSVAQIHALLYASDRPLHAEQIAATLSLARSNVSTSLRELLGWGLIRPVPVLGDRRRHYESLTDVGEMFRLVLRERKRRELDPTLAAVRACLAEAPADAPVFRARLGELAAFFDRLTSFYEAVHTMPRKPMERLLTAGRRLQRLFGGKGR